LVYDDCMRRRRRRWWWWWLFRIVHAWGRDS
jgi:hypothetical protein